MKNDGKKSEELFAERISKYGKSAYLERLIDTKSLSRKGVGVKTFVPKRPSDYILTIAGQMGYTEVKSTSSTTGFSFSALNTSQMASLRKQVAASGNYWIIIHRLETNEWYWLHGHTLLDIESKGKKSMTWDDLLFNKWVLPNKGA